MTMAPDTCGVGVLNGHPPEPASAIAIFPYLPAPTRHLRAHQSGPAYLLFTESNRRPATCTGAPPGLVSAALASLSCG